MELKLLPLHLARIERGTLRPRLGFFETLFQILAHIRKKVVFVGPVKGSRQYLDPP